MNNGKKTNPKHCIRDPESSINENGEFVKLAWTM